MFFGRSRSKAEQPKILRSASNDSASFLTFGSERRISGYAFVTLAPISGSSYRANALSEACLMAADEFLLSTNFSSTGTDSG